MNSFGEAPPVTEEIPLDDGRTAQSVHADAGATASTATAPAPAARLAGNANRGSGMFSVMAQQLREEVGMATASEYQDGVAEAIAQLEHMRSQQQTLLAHVAGMKERYVALTAALAVMGETLYEIGIAEQEGLRQPMIATGDSLRHIGQLGSASDVALEKQFDLIAESFVVVGKVVQDARDTQESLRKARLLFDGLERQCRSAGAAVTPAMEADRNAAKARYDDQAEALKLKVALLRQHTIQSLIRNVEAIRTTLLDLFSGAAAKLDAAAPARSQAAPDGPQTKRLEKLLSDN